MSETVEEPIEEPGRAVESIDWWGLDYAELDEQLVCPICRTALVDPYCTDCGHTFCKDCILATNRLALEDRRPTRCPVDRKPVLQEPQPAPLIVRSLLDNLVVRCPFAARGCQFRSERWLLESHVALDCAHVHVACHAPCARRVERRHFSADGCACSDAGSPEPPCEDEVPAAAAGADAATEPAAACPGRELGCQWQPDDDDDDDDGDDCAEHAQRCPLALMARTVQAQSAKIESVQLENRALRRQLEIAARQVQRSASDLDSQILSEYERLWSEIKEASQQQASQQQFTVKLSMENARISEELSFVRSSVDSLRRQMQLMSLSHRRMSLYSSFTGNDEPRDTLAYPEPQDGGFEDGSRQRRSVQKL